MPTLNIDGKEITVDKGTTVIQAAEKLAIDIPRYCYHPGLSIAGNCRMCLVEIEKFPKLQISCHMQAQDGMVVKTQTDVVLKTRQHILEFLLINHPLDCPVCDQAGECGLQDYYMQHGLYDSRFDENKVKKHKAESIGPTVMLDSERCILCSRCVRFTDEISKTSELGIFNRGDHSEIGIYPERELNNKYSGNVVDICPVGALTDKDFRFKCRVWYLESSPSVCTGCSMGCNIDIHYQLERKHIAGGDRVMRYKPRVNEEVNKWWICDEGRYSYPFIDHNRIEKPARHLMEPIFGNGRNPLIPARSPGLEGPVFAGRKDMDPAAWESVLDVAAAKLKEIPKDAWAVLVSPQMTNEELYLAKKFFNGVLGFKMYLISPYREGYCDDFLIKADKNPNTRGAFELGYGVHKAQLEEIVEKAGAGKIKGLYIFGQDLFEFLQPETAAKIFDNTSAVIFQGTNWNRTAEKAGLILPGAVFAEKDGTFTNFQRRVQRIFKAFEPKGEARPDWEILSDLAARLGHKLPYKETREIFDEIAAAVPVFQGLTYTRLGKKGAVLA